MKKILCVCFGNSCRSPMMKVLLAQKLKREMVDAFVDSAGIAEKDPTPASDHAKAVMKECSLSLEDHISKNIREVDLLSFDYILVVDEKTKEAVVSQGASPEKIMILNETDGGIPNPYGKDIEAYRECATAIYDSIQPFTKRLK